MASMHSDFFQLQTDRWQSIGLIIEGELGFPIIFKTKLHYWRRKYILPNPGPKQI